MGAVVEVGEVVHRDGEHLQPLLPREVGPYVLLHLLEHEQRLVRVRVRVRGRVRVRVLLHLLGHGRAPGARWVEYRLVGRVQCMVGRVQPEREEYGWWVECSMTGG